MKKILLIVFSICFSIQAKSQTTGTINGHKWVDLGLTSGTLWATCNIGANKNSETGYVYAWGEVKYPSGNSYKFYKSVQEEEDGVTVTYSGYTKYVPSNGENGFKGFFDNKYELEEEDDAAYINWGANWRIPSAIQCDELATECTQQEAEIDGIKGVKFTGPNGNYIFLPETKLKYWTRSRSRNEKRAQFATDFSNDYGFNKVKNFDAGERTYKNMIRPVCLYKNEVTKCATPTIKYENKSLLFECETENVEYHYSINVSDNKNSKSSGIVNLDAVYEIEVYATKDGYDKSNKVTATLFWTTADITQGMTETRSMYLNVTPLLISQNQGIITINGVEMGETIKIIDLAGNIISQKLVNSNTTVINLFEYTNQVLIFCIDEKSAKILIK